MDEDDRYGFADAVLVSSYSMFLTANIVYVGLVGDPRRFAWWFFWMAVAALFAFLLVRRSRFDRYVASGFGFLVTTAAGANLLIAIGVLE